MKKFKKFVGVLLCVAMLCSMGTFAFAETISGDGYNGNAHILDASVDTVIVPTTLKFALNPNSYKVWTGKYVAATGDFDEDVTYYKVDASAADGYAQDNTVTSDNYSTKAPFVKEYKTDQVVSLNYGIASKATAKKTVSIKFDIQENTVAHTSGTEAVTFVDEAKKAQAYNSTSNADGAKLGEFKMYLEIASAKTTAPTAKTHVLADEYAANTDYYKKNVGTDGTVTWTKQSIADGSAFDAETDPLYTYTEGSTIGAEITGAELSDVGIGTLATAAPGLVAFGTGSGDVKATATIGFLLNAATYKQKDTTEFSFSTTQADVAAGLDLSVVNSAAFTITGKMNPNADWSKAKAEGYVIIPEYTIVDATDDDTTDSAGYNLLKAATVTGTAQVLPYQNVNYLGLKGADSASFAADATITSITVNNVTIATAKAQNINGWIAIAAADLSAAGVTLGSGVTLNVAYVVDGTSYTASATIS